VEVQLYILPAVGTSRAQLVRAASVAGQVPLTSFNSGLLPFSPILHASAAAANSPFGLAVGNSYTLRYPGASPLATPGERGFYQLPVVFPGTIRMSGGAMDAQLIALNERIDFDTDHLSTTYAQYQANVFNGKRVGNGFRLVGAPVNRGPAAGGRTRDITGFGGFFLSSSSTNVYYSAGDKVSWSPAFCLLFNERWYSDDLKVLVNELIDIAQGSPDPALFQVPPDYTQKSDSHATH